MRGAPRRQVTGRMLRAVAGVGVAALAYVALRHRLPAWSHVTSALTQADAAWLAVAVGAELFSMAMFARQQRRLLWAFGVSISHHRAGAISWSRSAIAISLPGGSALSAGFAFRQFRAIGASRATAAAVMVLSAVVSFVALAALYLTGLLASLIGAAGALSGGSIAVLALAMCAVVTGTGLIAHRRPHRGGPPEGTGVPQRQPAAARLAARLRMNTVSSRLAAWLRLDVAVARLAEIRQTAGEVQGRHWLLALAAATANWLADLGCLVAASRAFDLPVGTAQIAVLYLGVQVLRQVPLTPGGIGVIEASLLAGMLAAGAADGPAAAAVVIYRLLSCWLVIPIGALAWASLKRRSGRTAADARQAVTSAT